MAEDFVGEFKVVIGIIESFATDLKKELAKSSLKYEVLLQNSEDLASTAQALVNGIKKRRIKILATDSRPHVLG